MESKTSSLKSKTPWSTPEKKSRIITKKYFGAQKKVEVDYYDCSAFKAGDNKRSSASRDKFDETGLFGCMCARHGIPFAFANLVQSGKKFKYPLPVLDEVFEKLETKNLDIMYDMTLNEWDGKCAVGIFHAYAHKPSCQVKYNPKYISGFGRTNGE
ncbi:hypothetical protein INT45_002650 [Circinella minor]|uniref:Uncharacterized protein n=1 Tax=Circinella minor TaxID=1195481 RepID=A0A8H7VAY0_9FUNG|nr:hypothetical protein INT45_002650 [Circinella minor]